MVDDRRPDDAGLPPDPTSAPDAGSSTEPPAPAEPPGVTPLVAWSAPPPEAGPWQYDAPPGWTGLDVMSVFGRTVDTFIAHWPTFVALTLPSVLVSLISLLVAASRSATATAVQPIDLLALLYIPIGVFVTTSIAMATDDVHAGRHVSALAVLGPAVGRAGVALVSAIVVWLVVIGLLLIPLILFSVAAIAGGPGGAAIGLIILLILGAVAFYGLIRWAFAPTAIAIDRAGPLSGLNRSWRLTRGNLWRLGVLVIGIALVTAPWSIAGSLLLLADKTLAGAVVGAVGTLLFGALGSIVVTIAYGDVTGRWLASQAKAEARVASGPEWWAGVTPAASSEVAQVDPASESVPESAPVEPAAAAAETPAPVAWGEAGTHAAPTPAPVAATLPAASPIAGVSRNERRVYVLGVFLVGCLLLIPSLAIATPSLGTFGLNGVPAQDRGKILAGTERDPANPCAPKAQATTFESSETIYVGGYFSRAVLPGQSATVHVLIDGAEAAKAPLNAGGKLVACYYEQEALTGLSPAEYRILVDDDTGVLAEGTFTVK
jgi:hypothetical protein